MKNVTKKTVAQGKGNERREVAGLKVRSGVKAGNAGAWVRP